MGGPIPVSKHSQLHPYYGPGPIWGPGPYYGAGPIWGRAHMDPGPYGPGHIWGPCYGNMALALAKTGIWDPLPK